MSQGTVSECGLCGGFTLLPKTQRLGQCLWQSTGTQIQDGHSPVPMAEDGEQIEKLLNAGIREISLALTQLTMSY